jgi:ATP-binding cassette subfamily E protein 1
VSSLRVVAGKTTFIRMLAGLLKADPGPDGKEPDVTGFVVRACVVAWLRLALHGLSETASSRRPQVSYKPQKISPKFAGTVRMLLHEKIRESFVHPQFVTDVVKPMSIDPIIDQEVRCCCAVLRCAALCCVVVCACRQFRRNVTAHACLLRQVEHLSGGELQRVALVVCLGKAADVYLIDEPSAYLDSEQRVTASKVCYCLRSSMSTSMSFCPCVTLLPRRATGHQALHFARQEDRVCGRARLHHGAWRRRCIVSRCMPC